MSAGADRFVSGRYRGVPSTPMSSAVQRARSFDDVINVSLGDPELTTDAGVIDAAAADAHAGHTHYTDTFGDPELRAEILAMYRDDHGLQVDPSALMVTTSGCHAMWLALEATLDDGDEVVICEPYFTPYPHQVRLARGVPVVLPTLAEEGFQINPERLRSVLTPRSRAIILNTPSNPTGACLSRATKEAVAQVAAEHDLIVISDEIYTLFSYAEPFEPFAALPGAADRTITIGSFSKDYVMTGWRIGYAVAPPAVTVAMKDVNENNVFTAPSVSQRAALHALRRRHELQPPIRERYRQRLEFAYEQVCATPHMSSLAPQGSIYLWVDIRATGMTSAQAADAILDEAHVLTLPGTAFGAGCDGYLRLAMTVGRPQIGEAFERLRRMPAFGG